MSDFYIGLLERTARESSYTFEELHKAFNQLVNGDGITVCDFVWLALEGML